MRFRGLIERTVTSYIKFYIKVRGTIILTSMNTNLCLMVTIDLLSNPEFSRGGTIAHLSGNVSGFSLAIEIEITT